MKSNALDKFEKEQINKGFWLHYENQAKAKQAEREADPLMVNRMAKQIRDRNKAEYLAQHQPEPVSPSRTGLIKVLRDWKTKYHRWDM